MSFLQPLFLWTLAGISVPLAIHLLSRREGKVVKIGSLRHVDESNTSRFKSLRLNELLLLLARCLMITWLALFLSGAQCTTPKSNANEKWLLVEQGMHDDLSVSSLIDSLTRQGFELRALSKDFPRYDERDSTVLPDYWSLAEDLRDTRDHDIIVLSYSFINGFTQQRINQPPNVRWISVDPGEREYVHDATQIGDSLTVRIGRSDGGGTSYSNSYVASPQPRKWFAQASLKDSAVIQPKDTITLNITEEQSYASDARILKAALRAIGRTYAVSLQIDKAETADWSFWLTDATPAGFSGNVVRFSPQSSKELIRQTGRSEWVITRRLTPEDAVESHFAMELAIVLTGKLNSSADKNDLRSMPDKMIWAENKLAGTTTSFSRPRDLSLILAVLFMLTWIGERSMALKKNL